MRTDHCSLTDSHLCPVAHCLWLQQVTVGVHDVESARNPAHCLAVACSNCSTYVHRGCARIGQGRCGKQSGSGSKGARVGATQG